MSDIEVKPIRKTILQTSIILNVSRLTIRRMADRGDLDWSDGQITIASIKRYLENSNGKRKKEESAPIKPDMSHVTDMSKPAIKPRKPGWIRNF